MKNTRDNLINCKRIIIKVGSSTITHKDSGRPNIEKIDKMARQISDLKGMDKDIVLVSSGAIATGRQCLNIKKNANETVSIKQALAAIGQASLIMLYRRLFSEYNLMAAQILMTKYTVADDKSRHNAHNTFEEIFKLGAIPIVNENDTVATDEISLGDNDTLSALVTALVGGDLLILLSDIDGLYTDDPSINKDAKIVKEVSSIDDDYLEMAKDTSKSGMGTGGMQSKLTAGRIATASGAYMVVASGEDMDIIDKIIHGEDVGTIFYANENTTFNFEKYAHTLLNGD